MVLLCLIAHAFAAAPGDLDGLVRVALELDPEVAALEFDVQAAQEEAQALGRPMNPMLMLGVDSLGAMPGDPDPMMYMVGVEQMLRGWGEGRAAAARAGVEVRRAEADQARVAADTRLRLAQSAARIRALQDEHALLNTQLVAAEALWQAGLRRWTAGASGLGAGGMGGMGGMAPAEMGAGMEPAPSSAPPAVGGGSAGGGGMSGSAGGGGMSGMAGMGGAAGGARPKGAPPSGMSGMADGGGGDASGMGTGGAAMALGSGLPELLRLEAEVARLGAERVGLEARLHGEQAVLTRFVGEEAAAAVRASPGAYRTDPAGQSPERPPELALAATERAAAEAERQLSRSRLAPDLSLGASLGVMPDGMVQGLNLMVGVEVPLWGGPARARAAASTRVEAATQRAVAIARELGAAADTARAAEAAAGARARVLREVAVPRADAAWRASLAQYAAGQGSVGEALQAWEGLLSAQRDRVAAERDEALRAAERARVETPSPANGQTP
jgi:outer membrane protein TolC